LFATWFETGVQHGLNHGLKPRSNPGYNRVLSELLRTKDAAFCNEVATVVRNQVVNKVANERFKQGGKKVGTGDCKCWNSGYKGIAEPSVAKMSLLVFMTEPREHATSVAQSQWE
jgi:hypothetical protein